jgi:hypothetical protein
MTDKIISNLVGNLTLDLLVNSVAPAGLMAG